MTKEKLEEAAREYSSGRENTLEENFAFIDFINGAKWQQERICDSEVIQRIRASKSDAEARRIIRTI